MPHSLPPLRSDEIRKRAKELWGKAGLRNTEAEVRRDTARQVGAPAGGESRRAEVSSLRTTGLKIHIGACEVVLLWKRVWSQLNKVDALDLILFLSCSVLDVFKTSETKWTLEE